MRLGAVRALELLLGIALIPLPKSAQCRIIGHTPSWVFGVAIGVLDRPVCQRCGKRL